MSEKYIAFGVTIAAVVIGIVAYEIVSSALGGSGTV